MGPSNNSLTAQRKTWAAIVDLWTLPSNTSWKMESQLRMLIHIKESKVHVNTISLWPQAKSDLSMMFNNQRTHHNSRLLLPRDQFLLRLRLIRLHSRCTPMVSSLDQPVENNSIMVFLLSDMELKTAKTTSLSKTHGDHLGELSQ